jgi:hypothetical protein
MSYLDNIYLEGYYDALEEMEDDYSNDYEDAYLEGYYTALMETSRATKELKKKYKVPRYRFLNDRNAFEDKKFRLSNGNDARVHKATSSDRGVSGNLYSIGSKYGKPNSTEKFLPELYSKHYDSRIATKGKYGKEKNLCDDNDNIHKFYKDGKNTIVHDSQKEKKKWYEDDKRTKSRVTFKDKAKADYGFYAFKTKDGGKWKNEFKFKK